MERGGEQRAQLGPGQVFGCAQLHVPVHLPGGWKLEVTDRSGTVPLPESSVSVHLDPAAVVIVARGG